MQKIMNISFSVQEDIANFILSPKLKSLFKTQ